ncbi:MAG: hypothetical protein KDB94_10490, partial [Acidobacteria bacterium]|nr:hypothetical protein [Acidobacteriota bacterium]
PLFFALCAAVGLTSRSFARALRFFFLVGVSAFAVYVPGLVRAWIYTGNPLFQVAPRLFEFDQRFLPVVEALEYQVRMFPLSLDGVAGAIADIPLKLKRAAVEMFPLYFLVPIGAVGWLTRRDATRWFGAALLLNYLIVAMLRGSIETVRYGSIFFLAALPVVAWSLREVFRRVSPSLWVLLILGCFASGTWTYMQRQVRWANFGTINWRYRPIIDPGQQLKWLSHSELRDSARPFHFVRSVIPEDAGVLVVDHPGPYYLRRRAWWCDYICKRWINDLWRDATPEQIVAELNERDLEYVLILDWVYNYPPIERALSAGALVDTGYSGMTSVVTLLRVAGSDDADQ